MTHKLELKCFDYNIFFMANLKFNLSLLKRCIVINKI